MYFAMEKVHFETIIYVERGCLSVLLSEQRFRINTDQILITKGFP